MEQTSSVSVWALPHMGLHLADRARHQTPPEMLLVRVTSHTHRPAERTMEGGLGFGPSRD